MNPKFHLLPAFFFLIIISTDAQNYLRALNPDFWGGPISREPDWHQYYDQAQLDDLTIIAEPQGIYTEIGIYATISQGDAWSWGGDYEIVWQFNLPPQTIVHDSWLWVGQDIIKADIIDYWTALETYEDIVDRNQDPSFFYRLPDNRYEIRIYPLFEGESRRIKMSFLVPTKWDAENVTTGLLQNLLLSTERTPSVVKLGMPVNDEWGTPGIMVGGTLSKMTNVVTNGAGDQMHYMEVPVNQFLSGNKAELVLPAPYSNNYTYLSTYEDGGDRFYQLVYAPDWDDMILTSQATHALLLLDYNEQKTGLELDQFVAKISAHCSTHFSKADHINLGIATSEGIRFLSDQWWPYDDNIFSDTLMDIVSQQDTIDLEVLLNEGFAWAKNQTAIDHVYLISANDDYVFPPYADDVYANIAPNIPSNVPFTLLDYQTENISVIYYGGETYQGNSYFHQLLESAFDQAEFFVLRVANTDMDGLLAGVFTPMEWPTGIVDFSTSLANGICYQRYAINDIGFDQDNRGVLLQTGKYLGGFPMNITANLILENGNFFSLNHTIQPDEIVQGDTLMREMWYGPHLKERELLVGSTGDHHAVIAESINERVLTGLTAFLALEPSQGGEPCIDCLFNPGEILINATETPFIIDSAAVSVTPNPVSVFAKISLVYGSTLTPTDWQTVIYNAAGRVVADLGTPVRTKDGLVWEWSVGQNVKPGIYFCKIQSSFGSMAAKVVVLPR